jgi:SPP1 family predicted phage head-tail adaptor
MIGKLRTRVTFKSKTGVSDGSGGYVNTLADYYTCWAEIATDSESKTDIVEKDSINRSIYFRIRYTTYKTFDNKLIISYKGNLYLINSVINEGDENRYFLIGCSSIKNG